MKVEIQGTGGSRTLTTDPDVVGYARITLTVTDGVKSSKHDVHFAASDHVNASVTTRWHTGRADASTAVAVGGPYGLVADDEDNTVRLYRLDRSGGPERLVSLHEQLGRPRRESDIEASARDGNRVYWLGSHSNSRAGECRPGRFRLFATDLDGLGESARLSFIGRYDHVRTDLTSWDDNDGHSLGSRYFGLAASTPCEDDEVDPVPESENLDGFNIEGLVMAPGSTSTAFVAFRAPLAPAVGEPATKPGAPGKAARTHALLVPVTNFDELAANGGSSGMARFGPPIRLDLGGRGIRSIDKNGSDEYVIVAGPPGGATGEAPSDFRLFTWNGRCLHRSLLIRQPICVRAATSTLAARLR